MREEKSKSGKVKICNKALFIGIIGIVAIVLAVAAIGANANNSTEASDKVKVPDVPHKIKDKDSDWDGAGSGWMSPHYPDDRVKAKGFTAEWDGPAYITANCAIDQGCIGYIFSKQGDNKWFLFRPCDYKDDMAFYQSDVMQYRLFIRASDGSVGIGTTEPSEKLDVEGNIHASGSIKSGSSLILDGPNDRILTTSGEMYFGRDPTTGSFEDVKVGIGTMSPVSRLDVAGGTISNVYQINSGPGTAQPFRLYARGSTAFVADFDNNDPSSSFNWYINGEGDANMKMTILENGNVGIGVKDPDHHLEVRGGGGLLFETNNLDDSTGALLEFNGVNRDGIVNIFAGTWDDPYITGGRPVIKLHPSTLGNNTVILMVDDYDFQKFKIRTQGIGTTEEKMWRTGGKDVLTITQDGNVGIGTTEPDAKLTIKAGADGKILKGYNQAGEVIVEIGEGLDYSETFPTTHSEITPGTVMVIDPVNKGVLTISTQAYDRKVAGVIAGAKGLGSGVRLGSSTEDIGDHAVALAGRVYCNVDTQYGDIEPGDLLTTSYTPGHAMVVKDFSKAQGATLGKAMEGLSGGGKGQILVLVTLQ